MTCHRFSDGTLTRSIHECLPSKTPRELGSPRPSSLESFARIAERVFGTDTLDLPAAKFFKSSLNFCKPQSFGITLDFAIKRGNQTLRELDAISQRELHCISRELI
ncbi:MAG: hypothetical protein QOH71_4275 [Blastocatellia bacterium]|nr:hypothetical protein [Blastocatellia bacterium]